MKKIILPLILILLLPFIFNVSFIEILKLKTFDALVKKQEPSGNFVILNITEKMLLIEAVFLFLDKIMQIFMLSY